MSAVVPLAVELSTFVGSQDSQCSGPGAYEGPIKGLGQALEGPLKGYMRLYNPTNGYK